MVALTLELVKNNYKESKKCIEFNDNDFNNVLNFHKSMWGYYHDTPLVELKELAKWLGIKNIFVKDESYRFGLKSFKGLGSAFAIASYLAEKEGIAIENLGFDDIAKDSVNGRKRDTVFCTASDGNHGLGLAWMSRLVGARAVIYLPSNVSEERINAIRKQEAEVIVIDDNYDNTVKKMAKDAEVNQWVLIQDTAFENYSKIPLWIIQGYLTMSLETLKELPESPTHVFLQIGVGSMAASVISAFSKKKGEDNPMFISVEPNNADCLYQSIEKGRNIKISGDMNTIMAGLSCGTVNPIVWDTLKANIDYSFSCKDEVTALGMRILGNPLGKDAKVVAGESGALPAGVIGLLDKYHNLKTELKLDKDSVILFFNTEGDVDSESYRNITWGGDYPIKYRRTF